MRGGRKSKNIGLIGAGGFALSHFRMLVQSGESNGMRLAAVADPTALKESTNAALLEHGIRRYQDYERMFAEEELDGVFVATPIPTHYAMTAAALRRGLRVYLEKPPVTSVRQLDELIALDANRFVQVGFNMNSWPIVRRALQRISRGDFGAIRSIRVIALWPRDNAYYARASWAGKMGTPENPIFDGPATNAMSHYVQLLCAGAAAAGGGAPEGVRGEYFRAREIESYDTCSLAGHFANGLKFSVVMSHSAGPGHVTSLTLEGEKASFEVDQEIFGRMAASRFNNPLGHAHRDFGKLVHQELERPRVSLADCRNFLEIVSQGLADSGGVHSIPSAYVSHEGEGPEELCVVKDLNSAAFLCSKNFQMFSEAGMPWRELSSVRN